MSPDEIFNFQDGSGYFIVSVIEMAYSSDCVTMFPDTMTVSYKDSSWELLWDDYEGCYSGRIDGKYGEIT